MNTETQRTTQPEKKAKRTKLVKTVEAMTTAHMSGGDLGKVERAQRRKREPVPACADPVAELRRLVQDHKALTKKATAIKNMTVDKKSRTTGEVIPSRVPEDRATEMLAIAKALQADAARLESEMTRALRQVPIYVHLLQHVFGLGPVVCAYLVALIDIRKATKISNLRRFCGLAVINGRLERPTRGVKLGYCAELRVRLYQAMAAMWKNSAKKTAERPNGSTSKYLDVWRNYKHRMLHSERFDAERNMLMSERSGMSERGLPEAGGTTGVNTEHDERAQRRDQMSSSMSGRPGARGIIHSTGWHKAADVLVEDIYVIWRAIEGLPVWPSYYAAKLGYNHGGTICVNAPKILTVEEALATVGHVGASPARAPVEEMDLPEEIET